MVFKRAVILFLFVSNACLGQYYYPLTGMMASALNPVFTSSLVAAYNADGSANDFKGYANGTLTNGATATGTPKVGTYSFSLDGVNDYVSLGSDKFDFTGDFSVAFWMNTPDASAVKCIMSNYSYVGTGRGWHIFQSANAILFTFYNAGTQYQLYTGSVLSNNTWVFVVCTFSSTAGKKIYINGSLSISDAVTNTPNYSTALSIIGAVDVEGVKYNNYYGYLDAIPIYNRTLSSTDVTTLYNSGNGLQPQ